MNKILPFLPRWLPSLLVMLTIHAFSSRPGDSLPDFLAWDHLVKKTGHILGYALLAWSFLHMLNYKRDGWKLVWLMSIFYAISDEFHQAHVPGRSPSLIDVMVFDNLGVVLMLWLHSRLKRE